MCVFPPFLYFHRRPLSLAADVKLCEPDLIVATEADGAGVNPSRTPDDEKLPQQWALKAIGASEAWKSGAFGSVIPRTLYTESLSSCLNPAISERRFNCLQSYHKKGVLKLKDTLLCRGTRCRACQSSIPQPSSRVKGR